jgi:hypothetical protein
MIRVKVTTNELHIPSKVARGYDNLHGFKVNGITDDHFWLENEGYHKIDNYEMLQVDLEKDERVASYKPELISDDQDEIDRWLSCE